MFIAFPFFVQGFQAFVEIPMRLKYHAKVFRTALEKEFERRHPIEKDAIENDPFYMSFWQVLHQQGQVIAKVQIGLSRRVFRQSASPDVVDP